MTFLRKFHDRRQAAAQRTLAVVGGLMGAFIGVAFTSQGSWMVLVGLVFVLSAGAYAWFVWFRVARSALIADEQGIEVRNPRSSTCVPWDEIQSVAYDGSPFGTGVVVLRSGRQIRAFATQTRGTRGHGRMRTALEGLEAERARREITKAATDKPSDGLRRTSSDAGERFGFDDGC